MESRIDDLAQYVAQFPESVNKSALNHVDIQSLDTFRTTSQSSCQPLFILDALELNRGLLG
ncbi:MAG: hypothetical protein GX625_18360 [Clostridiaceae bacterium]|jgi:hypothetical protein|nr:hypothetical protein [Clostridiaceae bacterium]